MRMIWIRKVEMFKDEDVKHTPGVPGDFNMSSISGLL